MTIGRISGFVSKMSFMMSNICNLWALYWEKKTQHTHTQFIDSTQIALSMVQKMEKKPNLHFAANDIYV